MGEATHLYAIAIGSNRSHGRFGRPAGVVAAAIERLDREFSLFSASPILRTRASGGAGRDFANAAALVISDLAPEAMLAACKRLEREFGRRRGRRWGARVLDLDLLAWSGGQVRRRSLVIPHPRIAEREFVLAPLAMIAPDLPLSGALKVRHFAHRLARRRQRR